MRIHLTGPISVEHDERALDERALPGRQGRVVFARLAWDAAPVHRDVLADLLWPDGLPATWERTLVSVISRLRAALAPVGLKIESAFGAYRLDAPAGFEVDVHIAAQECATAERVLALGDHAKATSSATVAAAICRRPFLAGDEGPWIDARRAELDATRLRALDAATEATLGTSEALATALEAVDLDPYRERTNLLVMRAHAALGNPADGLRAYSRYRSLLAEELGTHPGPDVEALYLDLLGAGDNNERLAQLERDGVFSLPRTTTAFVGRAVELDELTEAIVSTRLLTLTGAGGVGKTRLAVELARRSVDLFPDGALFVDLAPLSGAAPIGGAVGLAIGAVNDSIDAIAAMLDGRRFLLVLDNCEHLGAAVAAFVTELLATTTEVVALATSRSPLHAEFEVAWRVPSMQLPADGDPRSDVDSIALFCDRAAEARADFDITAATASAVAAICARLDGLPLAIELAAARTSSMSVAEIAEHLDERFALLRAPAGRLPRHSTLRATVGWSYDLLGPHEAEAFRSASVFEGVFDADDVAAVCGDAAARLPRLATQSLLVPAEGGYRMLETIKEYAREQASATDRWPQLVDRHVDHFVARLDHFLFDLEQKEFLLAARTARPDALAAIGRAIARGRLRDAATLGWAMTRFWLTTGAHAEARAHLQQIVYAGRAAGAMAEVAPVLTPFGRVELNDGDFASADRLFSEAIEMARARGDDRAQAEALAEVAAIAYATADEPRARELAQEALLWAERAGRDFLAGRVQMMLAGDLGFTKGTEASRRWAEHAYASFAKASSQSGMARAQVVVGAMSDPRSAPRPDWESPLREALELSREIGDVMTEAMALSQLGTALAQAGERDDARTVLTECLALCSRTGNHWTGVNCIERLGLLDAACGETERALTLWGAATALRSSSPARSHFDDDDPESTIARAVERAGQAAQGLLEAGAQMSYDDAAALALGY